MFCCFRSGEPLPQGLNEDGASTPASAARRGTSVAKCVPLSRLRAAPERVCHVEGIKTPSNALSTSALVYLQDRKRPGGKEARGTQVGAQGREEGRQSEASRSVPAAAAAQVRAALRHQCMPFSLHANEILGKFTWSVVARRLASSSGLWHRRGAKAEAKNMKDESSDDEEEPSES